MMYMFMQHVLVENGFDRLLLRQQQRLNHKPSRQRTLQKYMVMSHLHMASLTAV